MEKISVGYYLNGRQALFNRKFSILLWKIAVIVILSS
jgi:hypothetical protein